MTMGVVSACSSGGSGTPGGARSSTVPVAGGAPSTAAKAGCHSTTSATGGSGGGDVLVPGDIPDNAHYVHYVSPDGYRIDHPEGWAQASAGGAVTFTDKFNSIRVETTAVPTAPSVASAQANEVPALQSSAPCFEAGKVTSVSRKAGPAILITYRANSPADPTTGKVVLQDVERYEFWQGGKQATITLSSPKGSDNVDPWRNVTDSFMWGG